MCGKIVGNDEREEKRETFMGGISCSPNSAVGVNAGGGGMSGIDKDESRLS